MSGRLGRPPQAATSLELTTKLGAGDGAGWRLHLYPEAAEASGAFRPSHPPNRRGGGGAGASGRSEEEAARRARGRVRRYCAANRLNRLGTLTYGGVGNHDPLRLRAEVAEFFRALREQVGQAFPYLWVPEWHPGGHGLHVHFAVGRFLPRRSIERAWRHGFVHIKQIGDLPAGSMALAEARIAARYLAKYLAKDVDAGVTPRQGRRGDGLHRYEVAQGFQPAARIVRGRSAGEALDYASGLMGSEPARVWYSAHEPDWHGPAAVWASWDG